MSGATNPRSLSYGEYLALEQDTGVRHELVDGRAIAMSGGTPRHSAIKVNLVAWLRAALGGTPCRPYDSDLKLRVPASGLATYADAVVICGELQPDAEDPNAATNPTLLVEVLSPSTERWDRGWKWEHYRSMATLQHYLLVDPTAHRVEHYERSTDGTWRYAVYGPGERVRLGALGVALPVDVLYADVPVALRGGRRLDGGGAGVPTLEQRAAHEAGHFVYARIMELPVCRAWIVADQPTDADDAGDLGGQTRFENEWTFNEWRWVARLGEATAEATAEDVARAEVYLGLWVAGEVATRILLGEASPGARCVGDCACEEWCDYQGALQVSRKLDLLEDHANDADPALVSTEDDTRRAEARIRVSVGRVETLLRNHLAELHQVQRRLLAPPHCVV